jgi:hypothetical protein
MSGIEGAEREDFDDGEAGVGARGSGLGVRDSADKKSFGVRDD